MALQEPENSCKAKFFSIGGKAYLSPMKQLLLLPFLGLLVLQACSPAYHLKHGFKRELERSEVFEAGFTGFVLKDATSGATILATNAEKRFIPASNTKILTLAACLNTFGDSLPSAKLSNSAGDIWLLPLGDPTFLHPSFQAWQSLSQYLASPAAKQLYLAKNRNEPAPLGAGWAWDDVNDIYSAERSAMPVYGNVRRIYALEADSLAAEPPYWNQLCRKTRQEQGAEQPRCLSDNQVLYDARTAFPSDFELLTPVHGAAEFAVQLLEDTLHKKVNRVGEEMMPADTRVWYSCPADTVYRLMMQVSDNFLAEQLLLMCAKQRFDTLQEASVLRWATDSLFRAAPGEVRWVDGSGLSRYNLCSPNFLSGVLLDLWKTQKDRQRLLGLFPAGGQSGTIANWYAPAAGAAPYVFAKTGSMSGVYCLSGYLRADSGKWYVFSFMHNNFTGSSTRYKEETQRLLEKIRERG